MIKCVIIVIIGLLTSCFGKEKITYKHLVYREMDTATLSAFQILFNNKIKDSNWACLSVNKGYTCSIDYKGSNFLPKADLEIHSCNNRIELPFGISSARLFVITDLGVYFPIVSPYGYQEESRYSDVLRLDSLEYGFVAWQP